MEVSIYKFIQAKSEHYTKLAACRLACRLGLNRGNSKVFDADVTRIHPSQDVIFPRRLDSILESIKKEGGVHTPPPCVKVGEDFYLVDGHHRTAAQIALGYKTIKVRAVEVSPEEWEAEIQRLKEKG